MLAASDWVVWLTGFDPDAVPKGAEVSFEFARFGRDSGTFLLLLAGVVGAALIIHAYVRTPEVSLRSRTVLAVLRVMMLTLIVLALFEPRLTVADVIVRPATTVVLVDRSLSMTIDDRVPDPDDPAITPEEADRRRANVAALLQLGFAPGVSSRERFTVSRNGQVRALLEQDDGRLLRGLQKNNQLRIWQFDHRVTSLELTSGTDPVPNAAVVFKDDAENSAGGRTDLAAAIRQAVSAVDSADEQLAAVVIFSDGRRTAGDAIAPLASDLARRNAPVYVFAPGSDQKPANLRLTAVLGPERMFRGDPAVFDVTIRNDGCRGEAVVKFIEHLAGGREREIDRRTVQLDPAHPDVRVDPPFSYKQDENAPVGRRVLEAVIEPRDDETTPDNSRRLAVEVLERRARLLLLSGAPTYEFRFLKNLLIREKTIEVSCWLQTIPRGGPQPGNIVLEKLPTTTEELYEFDAVLAMDPDWNALGDDFLKLLEGFVGGYGGGLGVVAGETYLTQYLAAGEASGSKGARSLLDLLPLVPDLPRAVNDRNVHTSPLTMAVTDEGREHPLARLTHNPARVASTWAQLPPVRWAWAVAEAKPGATVYLRHASPLRQIGDEGEPMMAAQQFGAGRVVALSTDDTWRWRSVAEAYHERFWVQFAHHLIESRALGGRRRVQLFTDHDRVSLGELVTVSAQVLDKRYEPLDAQTVPARVLLDSGEVMELDLHAATGRPGWFTARFAARVIGTCEITVEEPGAAPDAEPASAVVQVEQPQIEYDDPTRDLAGLATITVPTHGRFLTLQDIAALPDEIPSRERRLKSPGRPHLLWATPLLLVLAGLFLCAEWIWRKRVQLV